jgi:glycerol-3-phosphate dehydrogenase
MIGSPPGSRLGPSDRAAALAELEETPFDIVVVGGGVTGAGIALDAATRGLSVALVERGDFASGTSSRSSKLIHGGLRYLEQRNFQLVREALHERRLLLSVIAPHLVRPIPFLLPVRNAWERSYYGAGIALYDGLSGWNPEMPRHRHLGRRAIVEAAPALQEGEFVGAIRYFDAQTDDARFALAVLRTALGHGAKAVSRAAVTGFMGDDRVDGVMVRDLESGGEVAVRARATILAAGVWSGQLEALAGVQNPIAVRASKGVHLLIPRGRLDLRDALILRAGQSVLLVIPWGAHWLIGTTDTPWKLGPETEEPTPSLEDLDYLLGHLNRSLRRPLRRSDVTGVFAGLRPLIDPGAGDTAAISREHVVRLPRQGLVTVAGGKYTTYRVMAAAAVDAAVGELGLRVDPSRTDSVPLVGAESHEAARAELAGLGLGDGISERLLERYGSTAPEVGRTILHDSELGSVLPDAAPYIAAEALYAVTHEGARSLEDVLARRTRITFEAADGGRSAAPVVARLVAAPLGWSTSRARNELQSFERGVEAARSAVDPAEDPDVAPGAFAASTGRRRKRVRRRERSTWFGKERSR